MSLLIDGYNLLHATGIFGHGSGRGSLQRSRQALLNFLVSALAEADLAKTTVVFDAQQAPPGLQRVVQYRGITVYFAAKDEEADDLIEELIQADSAPRRLTVVSSDHRLQRAARRRRAKAVDSDVWYKRLCRRRSQHQDVEGHSGDGKPEMPMPCEEVNRWLREFGEIDASEADAMDRPSPFPPGYAEDVVRGEEN